MQNLFIFFKNHIRQLNKSNTKKTKWSSFAIPAVIIKNKSNNTLYISSLTETPPLQGPLELESCKSVWMMTEHHGYKL